MKYFTAVLMLVCVVQALAHSNGDIRLVYGDSSSIGVVRMYYQGHWGRICNLGNSAADQVICRSAGFSDSNPIRFSSGVSSARILLDRVRCRGNESNILQCEHSPIGDGYCGYNEIAVDCYGGDIGSSVELRNGTSTDGVLLIGNNHGQIRTVCNRIWGYHGNSIVACRMLGVDTSRFTPIRLDRQYYGETTETADSYISHRVELWCNGNETNLTQCPHRGNHGPGITYCRRSDDVAIDCHGSANMEVSLVNGNATAGEVQVTYRGENGTLCVSGITGVAKVLCRMLGYGDYEGVRLDSRDVTNVTNLRFFTRCFGEEKNLAECGTTVFTGETCNKALAITCRPQPDIAVRLVDGNDTSGRLEVQRNGQWGGVCFTGYDIYHNRGLAPVVCRMLNLPTENAVARAWFPVLDSALILRSINCAGDEDNLNQCYLNTRKDCHGGHFDAWISCA